MTNEQAKTALSDVCIDVMWHLNREGGIDAIRIQAAQMRDIAELVLAELERAEIREMARLDSGVA